MSDIGKYGGVKVLLYASTVAHISITSEARCCHNTRICGLKAGQTWVHNLLAQQNLESGKTDLSRFPFQAFGAKDELLRQLPVWVIVLAGDGLVPFGVLTELDALPDDGFAFHDLHADKYA